MSQNTTKFTELDVVAGTATSTSAAATINAQVGIITTEALTTAASGTYTLSLGNALITPNSLLFVTTQRGTATVGKMTATYATTATGNAVIILANVDTVAVNGTIKVGFRVEQVA